MIGQPYMQVQEGWARFRSSLSARVLRGDKIEDLGVIAVKMVTDVWAAHLVDALQAADTTFSDYKYHDSGIGTTAEAAADTALETATGQARVVGSQTEGATGNIYKSVATITYTANYSITEHGLFNAATGPKLADRSIFTAIPITANNRIEFTYQLTANSGG